MHLDGQSPNFRASGESQLEFQDWLEFSSNPEKVEFSGDWEKNGVYYATRNRRPSFDWVVAGPAAHMYEPNFRRAKFAHAARSTGISLLREHSARPNFLIYAIDKATRSPQFRYPVFLVVSVPKNWWIEYFRYSRKCVYGLISNFQNFLVEGPRCIAAVGKLLVWMMSSTVSRYWSEIPWKCVSVLLIFTIFCGRAPQTPRRGLAPSALRSDRLRRPHAWSDMGVFFRANTILPPCEKVSRTPMVTHL